MNNSWLVPVLIVGAVMFAKTMQTWIRAKHGYPLEDPRTSRHRNHMRGSGEDPEAQRKIELLSTENERLIGQVSRLEERIAVLERIATDAPSRLSAEIENLR